MVDPVQRRPPFFWLSALVALAIAVLFVYVTVTALRFGDLSKAEGWKPSLRDGSWVVRTVDPQGPAAGGLRTGDVILALDGDARIGRIGPSWVLPSMAAGSPYAVDVDRDGTRLQVNLALSNRIDPSFRPWIFIHLTVAAVCFGLALVFGLARPDSRTARYGFAACVLFGMFTLWQALRPYDGVLQDTPLALSLVSTVPLYMIFAYLFMSRFPSPGTGGRAWSAVTWFVVVLGLSIWITRTANNVLLAFDSATTVELAYRYYAFLGLHARFFRPLEGLHVAFTCLACCAVQVRNYRELPNLNERRRIHWIVAGLVVGMTPLAFIGLLDGLARAGGFSTELAWLIDPGKKIGNVMIVLLPLAMGYAILRHRVLGIRFAIGMGLQYLLAKNLLRIALALPLLWIVGSLLSNPQATVGEAMARTLSAGNIVLIVAALFGLRYRTRLIRLVDRKFFRDEFDREQVLVRFSEAIRGSDSLADVLELAGSQLEAALHVDRVLAFDRRENRLVAGFSAGGAEAVSAIPQGTALQQQLDAISSSASRDELRDAGAERAADWMAQLGAELAVPVADQEDRLVGLLLLGPKRSEEKYTPTDREFLSTVAAQIGTAHEMISLRERVDRDRGARRQVLARLERRGLNFVRECPTCGRCYDHGSKVCEQDRSELVVETPIARSLDDKYRLDRLLGRGGMGAVYRALDLRLTRDVAVKIVIDSFYGEGAASRRFLREARASAKLEHPNIIRLYDYAAIPGTGAYLVLELLDGPTLRQELEQCGRFGIERAGGILEQLLSGIEAAHAAGVIHRDLKPANVMLARSEEDRERVKILDFGLAKVRESVFADPKSRTKAGVALGTLGYMSPEQLLGEEVDERTDIYALGVMALEILTGRLKLRGASFHHDTARQLSERLEVADTGREQRGLLQALRRATAYDREQRHDSIETLRAELLPALRACSELVIGRPRTDAAGEIDVATRTEPETENL